MTAYPQVILFGAIGGEWRERYVIPVLDELGVTYFNPVAPTGWDKAHGDREVEVMAHCETIVMVFNKTSPSFTGLAEAGWAALGAAQRGQHFILQIDLDYTPEIPESIRDTEGGQQIAQRLQHWSTSSRYLVHHHAQQFKLPRMYVADDMDGVIAKLREIYART